MERLTRYIKGSGKTDLVATRGRELAHRQAIDRLAAYEDTGLSPEEVAIIGPVCTYKEAEDDPRWRDCDKCGHSEKSRHVGERCQGCKALIIKVDGCPVPRWKPMPKAPKGENAE